MDQSARETRNNLEQQRADLSTRLDQSWRDLQDTQSVSERDRTHSLERVEQWLREAQDPKLVEKISGLLTCMHKRALLTVELEFLTAYALGGDGQELAQWPAVRSLLDSNLYDQQQWVGLAKHWLSEHWNRTRELKRVANRLEAIALAKAQLFDHKRGRTFEDGFREQKFEFLSQATKYEPKGLLLAAQKVGSCLEEFRQSVLQFVQSFLWRDPCFTDVEQARLILEKPPIELEFWRQFIGHNHPARAMLARVLEIQQAAPQWQNNLDMTQDLNVDEPISWARDDEFFRVGFARKVSNKILTWGHRDQPLVLGLNGEWGSGKSSVVNLIIEDLKNRDIHRALPTFVHFNPWRYSGQEALLEEFFRSVAQRLNAEAVVFPDTKDKEIASKLKEYGRLFKSFGAVQKTVKDLIKELAQAGTVVAVALAVTYLSPKMVTGPVALVIQYLTIFLGVLGVLGAYLTNLSKDYDSQAADKKASLKDLKLNLNRELMQRGRPLMIILDDIDRLKSAEVKQIFDLIKINADFSHTIFLLCYDRKVVAKTLFEEKRAISGDDYLKKIVHECYPIPYITSDEIFSHLLRRFFGGTFQDKYFSGVFSKYFADSELKDLRRQFLTHGPVFKALLSNLRQVKQLTRNLTTLLESVSQDVEGLRQKRIGLSPLDFLGIELLRLQCHEYYEQIRNRRDLFVGNSEFFVVLSKPEWAKDNLNVEFFVDENLQYEQIVDATVPEKHRRAIRNLTWRLFPKIKFVQTVSRGQEKQDSQGAVSQGHEGVVNRDSLASQILKSRYTNIHEGRVCSAEWFLSFFSFSIEVKGNQAREAVLTPSDKDLVRHYAGVSGPKLSGKIIDLVSGGQLNALSQSLQSFFREPVFREHKVHVFSSFAQAIDQVSLREDSGLESFISALCDQFLGLSSSADSVAMAETWLKSASTKKPAATKGTHWPDALDYLEQASGLRLRIHYLKTLWNALIGDRNIKQELDSLEILWRSIYNDLFSEDRAEAEFAKSLILKDAPILAHLQRSAILLPKHAVSLAMGSSLWPWEVELQKVLQSPKSAWDFVELFRERLTSSEGPIDWTFLRLLPLPRITEALLVDWRSLLDAGVSRSSLFLLLYDIETQGREGNEVLNPERFLTIAGSTGEPRRQDTEQLDLFKTWIQSSYGNKLAMWLKPVLLGRSTLNRDQLCFELLSHFPSHAGVFGAVIRLCFRSEAFIDFFAKAIRISSISTPTLVDLFCFSLSEPWLCSLDTDYFVKRCGPFLIAKLRNEPEHASSLYSLAQWLWCLSSDNASPEIQEEEIDDVEYRQNLLTGLQAFVVEDDNHSKRLQLDIAHAVYPRWLLEYWVGGRYAESIEAENKQIFELLVKAIGDNKDAELRKRAVESLGGLGELKTIESKVDWLIRFEADGRLRVCLDSIWTFFQLVSINGQLNEKLISDFISLCDHPRLNTRQRYEPTMSDQIINKLSKLPGREDTPFAVAWSDVLGRETLVEAIAGRGSYGPLKLWSQVYSQLVKSHELNRELIDRVHDLIEEQKTIFLKDWRGSFELANHPCAEAIVIDLMKDNDGRSFPDLFQIWRDQLNLADRRSLGDSLRKLVSLLRIFDIDPLEVFLIDFADWHTDDLSDDLELIRRLVNEYIDQLDPEHYLLLRRFVDQGSPELTTEPSIPA